MSSAWLQRRNGLNDFQKNLNDTYVPTMRRCVKAKDAEFVAAKWCSLAGLDLEIGGLHIGPDPSVRNDYKDSGDIHVVGKGNLEVKHWYKTAFSCRDDFPYPDIFVDTEKKVTGKIDQTWAWLTISPDMVYGALVMADTFDSWKLRKDAYKARGWDHMESVYSAPMNCVRFYNVTKPPKRVVDMLGGLG